MKQPETAKLFLPLQRELVALLRELSEADWSRPTVAREWTVKDVAAHLLDTDLRRLSTQRDAHKPFVKEFGGYEELVAFLNHLNAAWVETARRLSPRVLTDLLEWTGPQVAELFVSLAPDDEAFFPVAWAGEERSANWMDVGREYTEKWHHQAQIRDAVGAPALDSRRWLGPVLELSMYALPHAFRATEAVEGSALSVRVEGEAGGGWHILRARGGWELREGEAAGASARVRLDADTAWRLFSSRRQKAALRERLRIGGDQSLGAAAIGALAVMA
jgi:uncharacterized protein (TIGR03083 family)